MFKVTLGRAEELGGGGVLQMLTVEKFFSSLCEALNLMPRLRKKVQVLNYKVNDTGTNNGDALPLQRKREILKAGQEVRR